MENAHHITSSHTPGHTHPYRTLTRNYDNENERNDVRRLSNRNWRRWRCAMRAERSDSQSKCARVSQQLLAPTPATCHNRRQPHATTLLASTAKSKANTKHTHSVRPSKVSVCKGTLLSFYDSLSCSLCCAVALGEQLLAQLHSCCSSLAPGHVYVLSTIFFF